MNPPKAYSIEFINNVAFVPFSSELFVANSRMIRLNFPEVPRVI